MLNRIYDFLFDVQLLLTAWINSIDCVSAWLDWITVPPEKEIAPFYYWNFWNSLNGNGLNLTPDEARESFYLLYPNGGKRNELLGISRND